MLLFSELRWTLCHSYFARFPLHQVNPRKMQWTITLVNQNSGPTNQIPSNDSLLCFAWQWILYVDVCGHYASFSFLSRGILEPCHFLYNCWVSLSSLEGHAWLALTLTACDVFPSRTSVGSTWCTRWRSLLIKRLMHLAELINYPHTCDTDFAKRDIHFSGVTSPYIDWTWKPKLYFVTTMHFYQKPAYPSLHYGLENQATLVLF
jgi:hypothetical protein